MGVVFKNQFRKTIKEMEMNKTIRSLILIVALMCLLLSACVTEGSQVVTLSSVKLTTDWNVHTQDKPGCWSTPGGNYIVRELSWRSTGAMEKIDIAWIDPKNPSIDGTCAGWADKSGLYEVLK